MKAVMISIQPRWCELIASGKKIIEVRKTRPALEAPFKCYIYCTKGSPYLNRHNGICYLESKDILGGRGYGTYKRLNGLVIGEFICDTVIVDKTYGHDPLFRAAACMNQVEAASYCLNAEMYGWHISDLKLYDKPKPLRDFYKCGALSIDDLEDNLCDYCVATEFGEKRSVGTPNGPIMCEGRFCDTAYQKYLDEEFQMTRPPQSWCYCRSGFRSRIGCRR